MRLLNVHSLDFANFHFEPDNIPRYVIASHRWIRGSETTLEDFKARRNSHKAGYRKVLDLAAYVKSHVPTVGWIWIDTCCIDNRNSQEVSTAINSMFRWYARAELCLAYLQDVSSPNHEELCRSEWWTRAWTLQELLAPTTVVFLTQQWQVIGHKGRGEHSESGSSPNLSPNLGPSLDRLISSLTTIPENVLRDYNNSVGIRSEAKLAWAEARKASREEDLSYCLLGLLDVAMVANYGEGGEKARRRLLREVEEADRYAPTTTAGSALRSVSRSIPGRADPPVGDVSTQERYQRLIESLHFPQIRTRRDQIHITYHGTYHWILPSDSIAETKWDGFLAWLRDPEPVSSFYWINAKPGAGKSCLIRFLEEKLDQSQHAQPWCRDLDVLVLSFYFWSPGNFLQKTLVGLMRTILHQLLERIPENLVARLPPLKAKLPHSSQPKTAWTLSELRQCLRDILTAVSSTFKILFLIDGLDEIDGDDNERDDLLDYLRELASYPNVKLCVSSRRWTVFQDAFKTCPQLQLEDLNAEDISAYVLGQLKSQERFRQMLKHECGAEMLTRDVLRKAEGVFLWVRLVVKDLLRAIRDGDSFNALQQMVRDIPGDLHEYFSRMMDSIDVRYRPQACAMIQIALYKEADLWLMDFIFISHGSADFALSEYLERYTVDLREHDSLIYNLDTSLRMLSSRCKGLLECYHHRYHTDNRDHSYAVSISELPSSVTGASCPLLPAYDLKIDFMHRSLRDYLLEPDQQRSLQKYTGGPLDAQNYLRNARLCQLFVCQSWGLYGYHVSWLLGNFVGSLSSHTLPDGTRCAQFAKRFQPIIGYILDNLRSSHRFHIIHSSFLPWEEERSSLITLAIDFKWTGYINETLTAAVIREKGGRPILDYILQPRFIGEVPLFYTDILYQFPSPALIENALALGANPNEIYGSTTLWVRFLSLILNTDLSFSPPTAISAFADSIAAMVKGGANPYVTKYQLSKLSSSNPLPRRVYERHGFGDGGEEIPITTVFECLRPVLGDKVDGLKTLAEEQRTNDLARGEVSTESS